MESLCKIVLLIAVCAVMLCSCQEKPPIGKYQLLIGEVYSKDKMYKYQSYTFLAHESDSVRLIHSLGYVSDRSYVTVDLHRRTSDFFKWLTREGTKPLLLSIRYAFAKDFSTFEYNEIPVDLDRGNNTLFYYKGEEDLPVDSIGELRWYWGALLVVAESDYSITLPEGTVVPHAARFLHRVVFSNDIQVLDYDRERQCIVSSKIIDGDTRKIIKSYQIEQIIDIDKELFYKIWDNAWTNEDMIYYHSVCVVW